MFLVCAYLVDTVMADLPSLPWAECKKVKYNAFFSSPLNAGLVN